jgi:hypothetical protein
MKPLAELTIDDLLDCAAWKLDLRAKVVMPNEGRVMPRPKLSARERALAAGILAVRTRFLLADGSGALGYCFPSVVPFEPSHLLGYMQPAILSARGRVPFWFGQRIWVDGRGRVCGTDLSGEEINDLYRRLGKPAKNVFPITFEAEIALLRDEVGRGVIPGFGYVRSTPDLPPQGYAKHGSETVWVA